MTRLNQVLLALLALQGVALLISGAASDQGSAGQPAVKFLAELDTNQVTEIEILGAPKVKSDDPPQNRVVLGKKGDQWGIKTADGFPVEKSKVDELLTALSGLESRNRVLDSSTYHDKLEVADAKFQRKVTITAGKKYVLYVGTSPKFKTVHLREEGQDAVYLVSDFGTSQLGDRAWSWVGKAYLKLPANEVWQVKVQNAKGEIQLDKDPVSNEWAVLGMSDPINKSAVTELVNKASTVNLEAPVGKKADPSYGLDAPTATVTLTTGTSTIAGAPPKTTDTVTLKIGKKIDSANQYYVKASTSPYVVKVTGWSVQPLIDKATADLAEKKDEEKK